MKQFVNWIKEQNPESEDMLTPLEEKPKSNVGNFDTWLKERDPDVAEGIGIIRIVKQMIPGGSLTFSLDRNADSKKQGNTVKGTGPDEKTALKNALEKTGGKPEDLELVGQDNDVYTFKKHMANCHKVEL